MALWVRDCLKVTFGLWLCASGWDTTGIPCSASSPCAGVYQHPVLPSPAKGSCAGGTMQGPVVELLSNSYLWPCSLLLSHTRGAKREHGMSQDEITSPTVVRYLGILFVIFWWVILLYLKWEIVLPIIFMNNFYNQVIQIFREKERNKNSQKKPHTVGILI